MENIKARMTKVVVEAEQAGRLPPTDMHPGDFNVDHGGAPTTSELQSARARHHLACALSVAFCHHNTYLPTDRQWRIDEDCNQISGPPECTPEEPSRMPEWSARVHKDIYRTMIAGAALAGIYNEPLFRAKTHSDPRIQRLARNEEQLGRSSIFVRPDALSLEEYFAFLNGFPVCRITLPPETEGKLFGPLAAWLVDNIVSDKQGREAMETKLCGRWGRGTGCDYIQEPSPDCPLTSVEGGKDHSDAHLLMWEIMQIVWAFIHILGALQEDPRSGGDEQGQEEEEEEVRCEGMEEGSATVEAVAVFFGTFQTQQVIVPKHLDSFIDHPTFRFRFMNCRGGVDDDGTTYRIASKRGRLFSTDPDPGCDPWSWDDISFSGQTVVRHFEDIYHGSRQPNCWIDREHGDPTEAYVTPLLFKFFQYALEHHLRTTFMLDLFCPELVDHGHRRFSMFLWDLGVFAHDDDDLKNREWMGFDFDHAFISGVELVDRFVDGIHPFSPVYRASEGSGYYVDSEDEEEYLMGPLGRFV